MRTISPRTVLRLVAVALLVGATVVAGCSDDDNGDSEDASAGDTEVEESDEDAIEVVEDPEAQVDYGILADDRTEELVDAAREHFGDRWAGVSFEVPDDEPNRLIAHIVDLDEDADLGWLRARANEIDAEWDTLIGAVNATLSMEELRDLLETVLERMVEVGEPHSLEIDIANNRIVVTAETLDDDQREGLRGDLPPGSVAFSEEVAAEEAEEADAD